MSQISDGVIFVWHVAALEAGAGMHRDIKPGHFFVALCKVCDLPLEELLDLSDEEARKRVQGIETEVAELRELFSTVELQPAPFRRFLRALLGVEGVAPGEDMLHRSPDARRLFDRADALCAAAGVSKMRPVHLLWALAEQDQGPWTIALSEARVSRTDLLNAAQQAGTREGAQPQPSGLPEDRSSEGQRQEQPPETQTPATPALDEFGRDLTQLAREGRLHPLIGRQDVLRRLGQVLLQKERNCALLVGEAGVGKTAIVEGLAQRFADPATDPEFQTKRLVEVSLGALVANARHRGEFEERLRLLVAEASNPEIILFVDEMHTLVGAGAGGEALDAANLLKPALARGEIRCLGATTPAEHRRYLEKDAALQRRFQVVWVEEPSRSETLEMLRGLRAGFEQHHGLSIADEALDAAVDLSIRYLPDLRLPDKAIELLDATCAGARLRTFTKLAQPTQIGRVEVAQVVATRCRVPVESLTEDEASRLLRMEESLRLRVMGQEEALATVAETIRTARVGLRHPRRPWGVFLFLGPTGTGKTELAKALAEFLFGDENRLIRIDMSEFAERHTVSRLIGAPPGYVGYEEEGRLIAAVRKQPHSVVLFDEVEKAHPEVHQLFLQMFDEGCLTDGHGRQARFSDTVIILTSNLGASAAEEPGRIGFRAGGEDKGRASCSNDFNRSFSRRMNSRLQGESGNQERERFRQRLTEAVRRAMPPELINRIGRLVFFDPLTQESVRGIIGKFLDRLRGQLMSRRITLTLDDSAYELLMREGYSEDYGAREMERAIDRLVAQPIGRMLIDGSAADGAELRVYVREDEMRIEGR